MNKATSVQSFTYLGLVVSEKNVPKIDYFYIMRIWLTISPEPHVVREPHVGHPCYISSKLTEYSVLINIRRVSVLS